MCSSDLSTRTRTSFSLAAKRLGADTVEFAASGSSLSKGETFIDTAKNIEAMNVDAMVVRHHTPGTPHLLAQNVGCGVVNAGDGRSVEVHLLADLLDQGNTVVLRFLRPEHPQRDGRLGRPLEPGIPVRLILRPDIEEIGRAHV